MRRVAVSLALALLIPAAALGAKPLVIVLSWDGVRHDFPDRTPLPGLDRMERAGVRAERLVPVFPSNTFPAHVSLATGTHPDRHGILDNRFYDRERGRYSYSNDASWIEAEPLWSAAERQGVRAAVFFWVGSETDWRGVGATHRRAPFDGTLGEEEKLAQLIDWIDLPEHERPGLVMSWWHGTDSIAHRKGPNHPDVIDALREQDEFLQQLFAALDARDAWDTTTVFVVSDHGVTAVDEIVAPDEVLEDAGIAARVVRGSSVAHVFLADPSQDGEAARALGGIDGVEVYRRADVPERLRIRHASRNGDLVLVTHPPRTFTKLDTSSWLAVTAARLFGWQTGSHGYEPDHPDMGAIFFALGRGVPHGKRLPPIPSTDVAPTVAALLGIDAPRDAEGTPISGLGAPPLAEGGD